MGQMGQQIGIFIGRLQIFQRHTPIKIKSWVPPPPGCQPRQIGTKYLIFCLIRGTMSLGKTREIASQLWKFVKNCNYLVKIYTFFCGFAKSSAILQNLCKILRDFEKSSAILQNLPRLCKILRDFAKSSATLPNLAATLQNFAQFYKILSD